METEIVGYIIKYNVGMGETKTEKFYTIKAVKDFIETNNKFLNSFYYQVYQLRKVIM